jgi:uncharacterized OsmC-like protein
MVGLRDYLVGMRETIRAHRKAAKDAPLVPRQIVAKVTAMGGSGARKIQIRDFELISDAKPEAGGFNLGPTPVELTMGALGACISSSFLHQAAMRGIPVDELVIEVTAQTDPRGAMPAYPDIPNHPHNIQFTARVGSPATDDELQLMLDKAEATCSVSNLIRAQETVTGRFERTRDADAPLDSPRV